MIGAVLAAVGSPIGRRIASVAGVLAAVALTIAGVYAAGLSAGKAKVSGDRDAWRRTAGQYQASAKAWEKSFRSSDKIRGQERSDAVQAIDDAAKACDARVAAARRSSAAIHSIVTREVRYDESRCPVRAVVGSGELRDALGLAAGGR